MGKYRTRELTQRVRYALLAGVAGAFLIPQVAAAAPTGHHDETAGVHVAGEGTATTTITATDANNVIKWADYSVKQGETVNYDGKNYLNIVTGGNTSAINGTINNAGGDIYLVNPNGVIFGKTASVNVGNLYVSTQEESTLNMTAFTGSGHSPLSTSAGDVGKADVVNMGSVTANKVEVYGRSIRILDAANVHATTSPVILHTDTAANDGYAHIGYKSGAEPAATAYKVNGANAVAADNYYQLVSTPTEFQNINNDLAKNYMLSNDIDFTDPATHAAGEITPIGGNTISTASGTTARPAYSGKFDGNFFRVQNYKVTDPALERAGLFGELNHAQIYNLGVTGATVTGNTSRGTSRAGGVAGYSYGGTSFLNVYIKNSTINGVDGYHGGLIGYTTNTTLDSVYSKATIGEGGGIIGYSSSGTKVSNAYSDVEQLSGTSGTYFIYYVSPSSGTTVTNAYATGLFSYSNSTPNVTNTFIADKDAGKIRGKDEPIANAIDGYASKNYAAWGNAINNTGAPGAKWRIYEGRTLPLLTAFMDGTATATYDTRYFNANGTLNSDGANTPKSNKGADIETTYNSQYVKIVGKASGADVVGGKSNVVTYAGAMQYNADGTPNLDHIYDYVNTGTNDFDKTNGIRNAGTKAILWSDQDGPNLRGVNVTVKQREVKLNDGTIKPDRMYNGKSDVTQAFIDKLTSGNISSSGFTTEDINAHSVNLDFTTGSFKAQAYNLEYVNASGATIAAGTHADKNVGVDKPVKFTGSISFSGDDAANYYFNNASLSNITGTATITKAPLYLKINKTRADAKIYDGTDAVLDLAMKQTGTTTPNITLNKDNYAPASTVTSPTHHKGEIMLDDGNNPDDVDLTQVTDPTYTDTTGAKQIHVGDHKLQYKNVGLRGADAGNYDLYLPPIPAVGNGNKVVGNTVYLDGEIIRREITRDSFKVYDSATNAEVTAEKVYDGNATYTPGESVYLSTNAPASGNVGIVTRDQGHIKFALTGGTGTFKDATGANSTKNVAEARKIAYNVTGVADTHTDADGIGHKLDDYYVLDADGVTKHALSSAFDATGQGRITPKALTATVVNNHITKVYDAKQNQTDGNRNDIIGDALVTLSGFVSGETRTNTSTAMYASPNVAWDNTANAPTSQAVTYTAKFDRGTGAEADNYTFDTTAHTTTVTNSASVSGSYTGTITPRDLKLTFGDVTKVYDGTADNATKNVTALDDSLSGAVTTADGTTAAGISAAALSSATSSYGDFSGTTFKASRNAGNRVVEYVGLAGALGTNHNYAIADKQYGKGEITRRRIDPSGFQVRKAGGAIANASKVYDGTDRSDLPSGASLVTPTATSGNTGIVAHDAGKITFKLKDGTHGYFSSDADGNNRTSHVSEARHVAYDIVAHTDDETNNPLSNYTFGSATATTLKNLEDVNNTNPAHVTAAGTITAAALHAQTHSIEKVYDGLAAHTDGNRAAVADKDTIITFTGWVVHDGITEKRTNNSSAVYLGFGGGQGKDVAYDAISGDVTTKNVKYTAALTGNYADDYRVVDITGAGAATATLGVTTTVANAGKITPRALKIVMNDVSKTYDGNAKNTTVSVKEITDTIGSAVIDDILSDDNVTALDLTNQYTAKMTAAPANYKSAYGRGNTDGSFAENVNASNGTPHDVQYTNMREAFRTKFGSTSAVNYSVEKNAYGKGTINRRNIDPNNFDVVDDHDVTSHATKEYDGTTTYNVPTGWKLSPSTGPSTGVIPGDDVTFHLTSDGAQFTTAGHNPTPNAYDAAKVMYNVVASGDREKIKNYTLGGRKLEEGKAKVYGEGKITRRVLSLALVNNTDINKVYDGQTGVVDTDAKHWTALTKTDAKGNVTYAAGSKELVNDGSSFHIEANYRNSANTANDKNVAYSSATPREVIAKAIEYSISITGGDARNYAFANGTPTPTNAENGLKLSATGKITPKDLSGAFKKITKVYDGTKNVPAADVEFKTGADGVIEGDNITFTHTEAFQSENVRGDGTTKTIDGAAQKNWVNYSGLSLGGTSADNYTINATAVGLGEITPLELNPSTVTLATTQASKTYDGTKTVKWTDGSDAISAIKNYITGATVTVGGSTVSVLPDLELQSAEYDTKNVVGGSQPRVTYHMKYKGTSGNFTLAPGAATFDGKGNGVITPKDVTATIKGPLTKVYDATADTIGAAKNATTGAAVVTADDLVTFVGLVAGDGATNATTATFDNKNVGTNKNVTYDIKLDTASAGNYSLKYNGAAITAPITQAGNTITKRKVNVTFGEQHKSYDGLSTNTAIDASISAADAAVLNLDHTGLANASNKLTNLTATGAPPNIVSNYGKRTGTGFTTDANAGTNKDVQYAGLRAAMNTSLGGDAGNYEFDTDGYGKGYIERATINVNDPSFTFTADPATKVYDGTTAVKYNGSAASNDVRNYITNIGVTLNGHWVDLSGSVDMDLAGTKYSGPNATNGTPDTVTYKFRLNTNNIIVNGGTNEFTKTANGTIDRRVLKLGLAQDSAIDKIYDANAKLIDTNTRHYDKFIDDDASGNVIYAAGTTNDNKLVRTSNGASVNDGAKMTITANYVDNLTSRTADKNVARNTGGDVIAKDIAYNVKIDAANGGKNYKLSHGTTTVDAENGLDMNASGTISPRKITLVFADADKMYDTMSENTLKNISSVTPGNSDGRGAATLTADGITAATFDMTGVASDFGKGTTDAAFTADPNVVLNASGTVSPRSKDVQYRNLKDTLNAQPYAGNYEIADTSYGKGAITKRTVTRNDFDIQIAPATKEYDATDKVVWTDPTTHISYNDLEHAKNYFTSSTLKLRNSTGTVIATKNINLADIELLSAAYNGTNVVGTNQVNYGIRINTTNFDFTGPRDDVRHTAGTITPRDLATKLPTHLIKEYDGERTFDQDNKDFVNAMANERLTGIVAGDANKVHLAVTGTYSSKNASAETREDALDPAHTPGRTVDYALTLTGSDPDALSNYTLSTTNVNGRAADIYKKKLTVDVERKEKDYDGTADVTGLTTGDITFHGVLAGDALSLDAAALTKINGQYLDDAGQPSADVRRNANHAVTDKAVGYTGLNAALIDRAARDTTAGNYRVDDTKNYTVGDARGRIRPLHITPYDPTPTDPHRPNPRLSMAFDATGPSKVYDGTATVKHNGVGTEDALKNYLTGAKVILGGTVVGGVVTGGTEVNIWKDIAIDPTKTHYDDKMVGTGKNVTYGLKYTGNNFTIDDFTRSVSTGIITAKDVTVAVKSPLTKAYDATTDVLGVAKNASGATVTTADDLVKLTGLIAGDRVSNTTTAFYDTKNAGTGKTVAYTPSLSGADAVNYRLVDASGVAIPTTGLTSPPNNEITKRKVNVTFDTVSKPYDGTAANTTIDAAVSAADATVLNLDRTGLANASNKLTNLTATGAAPNITSAYGKRDHGQFTANPNVVRDANNNVVPNGKDVQYAGLRAAMNTTLGSDAGNYEFDVDGYGKGTINPVTVRDGDFALSFRKATKEYDGTPDVHNAAQYLDKTASHASRTVGGTTSTITLTDDDYVSVDGKYDNKNAGDPTVHYKVRISNKNFDFGTWDGIVQRDGDGHIDKRKLIVDPSNYLTKEYDGKADIIGKARNAQGTLITTGGDNLVKFHHYSGTPTHPDDGEDTVFYREVNAGTVSNNTTADYVDKNVEWQGGVWNQGRGVVGDKNVKYTVELTGTDATNYDIVHADGTAVTPTNPYVGKGRITPKEIVLKADPQERWINEGLPDHYTGTPMGENLSHNEVPEIVPSDTPLPGTIDYSSPNARLRVGYYAVEGTYHAPNGAEDGDSVSRNYRFIQDPANKTALYIGPYIPDYEYYKAMTQVSKMTPDEYAYENASLDRTNHYSRKPTAQVDPVPPAINVVKDGVDIRQNDINVLDETVYTIVDEVFG
ncbi:YDG domain-containing protein [uncultured Selenomonas sp.]|uniref:YDG domain-containing protein n=1 Tax=uncultured Selenomonas sp. TaxID=159275 RepID=UPI0028EF9EE7|nr:YDG domain-containing protein [uncultured Selenomonas sp.]